MTGIGCMMVAGSGGLPAITTVNLTGFGGVVDPSGASSYIILFANGRAATADGPNAIVGVDTIPYDGTWGTPFPGNGSGYWVRFTRTSAAPNPINGSATATTGWLQLNAQRSVGCSATVGHSCNATYNIDVATDAAGTTIVATQTGVSISAVGI